MKPYQEIDKWMFDIEKELKLGTTKRGPLQRKHMKLSVIRDKLFNKFGCKDSITGSLEKFCKERIQENFVSKKPSPGIPGYAPKPAIPHSPQRKV